MSFSPQWFTGHKTPSSLLFPPEINWSCQICNVLHENNPKTSLLFYSAFSDLESCLNFCKGVKQQIEKERRRKKKKKNNKRKKEERKKKRPPPPSLLPHPPPPPPPPPPHNNKQTKQKLQQQKSTNDSKFTTHVYCELNLSKAWEW